MAEIQNIRYGLTGLTPPDYLYTFVISGSYSNVRVEVRLLGQTVFQSYVEGVHYSHTPASSKITFLAGFEPDGDGVAPINGIETSDTIILSRFTTRDRQVDFQEGSTIKSQTLDNDADRLTAVTQEIEGGVTDALQKNAIGAAWDAEGLPSENASVALRGDGWPTLAQVQGLISGNPVAELTEPRVYDFTVPAGGQTQFEMGGSQGLLTKQPIVFVDGVIQSALTDYTVIIEGAVGYPEPPATQGDDYLTFTVALTEGSIVHVRQFTGQVLGVLPDQFINDPDQIKDRLIGLRHINIGSSAENDRFMVFDAVGDPVGERIGLQHLKATGQVLDPQSLTAMQHATTGLSLDGFNKGPAGPVTMNSKALTDLFMPVGLGAQDGDAVNRSFVELLFASVNNPIMAIGEVDEDDIPNDVASQFTIQIGFQVDVFMLYLQHNNHNEQYGVGWWIRGGASNQKMMWMAGFHYGHFFSEHGRWAVSSDGNFKTSSSGDDMLIVQHRINSDSGEWPNPKFIPSEYNQMLWFALKLPD